MFTLLARAELAIAAQWQNFSIGSETKTIGYSDVHQR